MFRNRISDCDCCLFACCVLVVNLVEEFIASLYLLTIDGDCRCACIEDILYRICRNIVHNFVCFTFILADSDDCSVRKNRTLVVINCDSE